MQKGFTLLEAMVTLALIAITLVITIPTLSTFLSSQEDSVFHEQWLHAISLAERLARDEGVSMGLTLCTSDANVCEGGESLIIYQIDDSNTLHSIDQIEQRIILSPLHGYLKSRFYPSYHENLVFLPTGLLHSDNGTFWYCHRRSLNPVWAVMVNKAGRARSVYPDKAGKIYDSSHQPLICDE